MKYANNYNNTVTFDYLLSLLCSEENIRVEIIDNIGEFETEESQGTIEFGDDNIILKVKNINYNTTFEKSFSYKSSDNKNEPIEISSDYIERWIDESGGNEIIIRKIDDDGVTFDLQIYRIVGYENLLGMY